MREIVVVFALTVGWMAPAFAKKAEIEAANAKWTELFNKGDFAGLAALYTAGASAFPPGSPIVRGRDAIGALWKGMAEKVGDPKLTTLDVKPLGPAAAQEIGTFSLKTKGPNPQEVTGKYVVIWRARLAARHGHLERWQVVSDANRSTGGAVGRDLSARGGRKKTACYPVVTAPASPMR